MISIDKPLQFSVVSTQPIQPIKSSTDSVFLRTGEVIRALVAEKLNSNEMLLETKGAKIMVKSDLPLRTGDVLNLKVETTSPQIVLSLVASKDEEVLLLRNNLAIFRAFPQGLLDVMKNGLELFNTNLKPVYPFVNKEDIESLISIVNNLIYSEKSLGNPLFLKDFIANVGYLLESNLKMSFDNYPKDKHFNRTSCKNLKGILTNLSSQLHLILNDHPSDLDTSILKTLNELMEYTDNSLKTILNHQIINVVEQEEDRCYFFQIPVQSSDDLKSADLFIHLNADGSGKKINNSTQFVLFLDIEPLGEIMADVKSMQGQLWVSFKCVTVESHDYLLNFLNDLNESLASSGYESNHFNVFLSDNLSKERTDFMREKIIYSKDVIDFIA